MPFQFERLAIPEVILIKPRVFADERGHFAETYKRSEFAANGIDVEFVQDNYSHSVRGVLRGLHFQAPPNAQAKLVSVVSGRAFDVAVDIRRGSPTYSRWVGAILSDEDHYMLYIPAGFAHGFCVLDEADFVYKVTAEYSPQHECGIVWNDPAIGIEWPVANPILSAKDTHLPLLAETDRSFVYEEQG
ncbi:MAG: dTDP-4-dehydrorhamnose 3,5-epimerase [Anaerolineae bacterium]|nr:dTDP-4-dehydrorhamnose 3,5-epimerase [Anaerolineae bacterium]